MSTLTAPVTAITLEMHHCDNRVSYQVTWEGPDAEARAVAYLAARAATHARPAELDEHPIPDTCAELLALLYPTCEHGLSESLCNGYGHY